MNCNFSILRRLRSVGQNMETGKEEESILFSMSACLLWENMEEWSSLQQWGFRWDIRKNFLTVSFVVHYDLRYLCSCLLMRLKNRSDKHLPSITDIQLLLPQSKGMDRMICGSVFHACFTEVPTVVYNYYGLLVLMSYMFLFVWVCFIYQLWMLLSALPWLQSEQWSPDRPGSALHRPSERALWAPSTHTP